MKKKAFSKMLAFLLVASMVLSSLAVLAVSAEDGHVHTAEAETQCPGKDKPHTLATCPDAVVLNTVEPTCGEWGYTNYQCPVCKAVFADGFVKLGDHKWNKEVVSGDCLTGYKTTKTCKVCGKVETLKATAPGHTWGATPTITQAPTFDKTGLAVYKCTACGATKEVVVAALHDCENYLVTVEEKAPTCTTAGNYTYNKCKICQKYFMGEKEVHAEAVIIPALGHDMKKGTPEAPSCTEATKSSYRQCSRCAYQDSIVWAAPLGHTAAGDKDSKNLRETKAPTCLEAGERAWECGRCNKTLTQTIPGGCDYRTVNVPATCQQYAYSYTYCTRVDCPIHDAVAEATVKVADGVMVTVAFGAEIHLKSVTVDYAGGKNAQNHTAKKITFSNPATCTDKGQASYKCNACGATGTEIIPALGHDFSVTVTDSEPDCTTAGVLIVKCSRCDQTQKTVRPATGHDYEEKTIEATCVAGERYKECKNCPDHVTIETIPALDLSNRFQYTAEDAEKLHDLGEYVGIYKEGSCAIGDEAIDLYKCQACNKYILVIRENTGKGHSGVLKDGTNLIKSKVEPTCQTLGYEAVYICAYCGEIAGGEEIAKLDHEYTEATCTEDGGCAICGIIPATGHNFNSVTKAPTCEEPGYTLYTCTKCGYEYMDAYVQATGHNEVTFGARPATCTDKGQEAGIKCSTCDKVLKGGAEIPALGHQNKDGAALENKCTNNVKDRVCKYCKQTIGSDHTALKDTTYAATCTDPGYTVSACADCGYSKVTGIGEANGHKWVEIEHEAIPATYQQDGSKTSVCSVCGEKKVEKVSHLSGDGILYLINIDNADIPGAGITDSSLVKVTVSMNAEAAAVWGFRFDLAYDCSSVEFVGSEFISDAFISNTSVYDHSNDEKNPKVHDHQYDYITVAAHTANNAEGKTQNYTISGDHAVVELYFRVKCGEAAQDMVLSELSFKAIESYDNNVESIKSVSHKAFIQIDKFLDVNNDKSFNLADILIVYKMIVGETATSYDVVVDIDKDGEITMADYSYMYEYLVGSLTYEELVVIGTEP